MNKPVFLFGRFHQFTSKSHLLNSFLYIITKVQTQLTQTFLHGDNVCISYGINNGTSLQFCTSVNGFLYSLLPLESCLATHHGT
jgi:hypothetical protein